MKKKVNQNDYTRKINPRLGLLGLLGFMGFLGFWTYSHQNMIFPFFFFGFFGFFGFYFEGKMQRVLKDEMYIENRTKAQLKAYKVGYGISCFLPFICTQGYLYMNDGSYLLIFLIIAIALNIGLVSFLSSFYLYRLENSKDDMEDCNA